VPEIQPSGVKCINCNDYPFMNTLSPIVLFAYNRPFYTEQCLKSLSKNKLADQSILYVYCDGPKLDSSDEELQRIADVRAIVRAKKYCKELVVIESEKNKGLAASVVEGVTEIVNKYGRVIVLEDDLILSPFFLQYMNQALDLYEDVPQVMQISAHIFNTRYKLPETFFYNEASCWGWGTWARAWKYLNMDAQDLLEKVKKSPNYAMFDLERSFIWQLESNVRGNLNTWAIRWNTSIFLNNGLCLHPRKTLTKNIGIGNTATHTSNLDERTLQQKLLPFVKVEKIELKECEVVYEALHAYFHPSVIDTFRQFMINLRQRVFRKLSKMMSSVSIKTSNLP
jgi:hypothetical protein